MAHPIPWLKYRPRSGYRSVTSFVNNNLFTLSSTDLSTNSEFQNIVNGLYITINRTKSTGAGGILMFSGTDSLSVYYHSVSGTTVDTAEVQLPIAHMAASITHTFTQTIQNELNNKTTGSRNTFYLQGLAGLRAKISFPGFLSKLRASLVNRPGIKDSDVLINRAELVITPQPGTYIPYSPLPKITMYQLDLALQPSPIQDASADARSGGASIFGGFYNPTTNNYHFILTAFLQDMVFGSNHLLMAPILRLWTLPIKLALTYCQPRR